MPVPLARCAFSSNSLDISTVIFRAVSIMLLMIPYSTPALNMVLFLAEQFRPQKVRIWMSWGHNRWEVSSCLPQRIGQSSGVVAQLGSSTFGFAAGEPKAGNRLVKAAF